MKKLFFIFTSLLVLSACGQKDEQDTDITPSTPPATEQEEQQGQENLDEENVEASIEDKITVNTPKINDEIASPVVVRGEARGTWFFEGSFPVKLLDQDGKELTHANATSTKSWMTEDFIPFEATLEFDPGKSTSGTIIIEKDNPSGLPENAGKLEIPVKF